MQTNKASMRPCIMRMSMQVLPSRSFHLHAATTWSLPPARIGRMACACAP
jgi:hypothetical protein